MQKNEQSIWQNYNILDALDHLNKTGHLSDINIRVGAKAGQQQVFKCHKLILAIASPYFEAMFFGTGDFVEKKNSEIEMKDTEPEDFKYFLEYVYSRREIKDFDQFSIESLQSFLYMGQKYLQPKYSEFGVVGIENAIPKLRLVDLIELFDSVYRVGHERLISSVSHGLQSKIATTTTFNPTLLDFELSTFKAFIECVKNYITERTRFNWIEDYIYQSGLYEKKDTKTVENGEEIENEVKNAVDDQTNEKKLNPKVWSDLFETISYVEMSMDELCNGPLKSDLLELEEKNRILVAVGKKLENTVKETVPLPQEKNCPHCRCRVKFP